MKHNYEISLVVGFYVDCKQKKDPTSRVCIIKQAHRDVKLTHIYPSTDTTMYEAQLDAIIDGLSKIQLDEMLNELTIKINFAKPYMLSISNHFNNLLEMNRQMEPHLTKEQQVLLSRGYFERLHRPLKYTDKLIELASILLLLDNNSTKFNLVFDKSYTKELSNAMKLSKTLTLTSSLVGQNNNVVRFQR